MIIDIFVLLIGTFLWILTSILRLVAFVIPDQIEASVNYILGYFGFITGIFPVETAFTAFIIYLQFILLLYTFKLIRWFWAHLPWVGKHQNLPDLKH